AEASVATEDTGAATAFGFVAVAVRLPLGASTATSEFLFVGMVPAAGAAFVFTLTAFAGGALTALATLAAGFAALTALAGLAADSVAFAVEALGFGAACFAGAGFGATPAGSTFFRVVFDAGLAGTLAGALAGASGPPRAFEAGLSRDLLAPARAMTAFSSSGPRASGRPGAARI